MAQSLSTKLATARQRRELLQEQVHAKRLERVLQRYDRLDTSKPNNDNRRTPTVELKPEDELHTHRDQRRAINIGRDAFRNFSKARAILNQFEVNVIGADGPKPAFHSGAADWDAAALRYWSQWAKDCDARDDTPLQEFVAMALQAVKRDGCCLCVFDDFMERPTGKLLWYEADQLVDVDEASWKADHGDKGFPADKYQQARGIVREIGSGRVVAYIVAAKNDQETRPLSECTIIPRERAKLLKKPWRFNQGRGDSALLTVSADLEDCAIMRQAELASAKAAARRAVVVKGDRLFEEDLARNGVDVENEVDRTDDDPTAGTPKDNQTYERLERFADGYVDYIGADEEVSVFDHNRPSPNVQSFHQDVGGDCGAALGIARVYTTLRAEASYTAFRGEMILSWLQFKIDQKWLERRLMDWLAEKVIAWGQRTAALKSTTELVTVSWTWPTMPEVDEKAIADAVQARLKCGLTTFAREVGPEWQTVFAQLSTEVRQAIALGLPLAMLETVAGAPAKSKEPTP